MGDSAEKDSEDIRTLNTKTDLAGEIESVDFKAMIGGAFDAVINAQWQAALTTINFIKKAGFSKGKKDSKGFGEPNYLEFKYERPQSMGMGNMPAYKVKIPMLVIVPIPYLRIDSMTVSFQVKLTQTTEVNQNRMGQRTQIASVNDSGEQISNKKKTTYGQWGRNSNNDGWEAVNAEIEKRDVWSNTSSMTGIITTSSYNNQGMRVSRDYSLKVDIEAVESAIPAGMERMLDILTSLIGASHDQKDPLAGFVNTALQGTNLTGASGGAGAGAGATGGAGGATGGAGGV
mmetsp:Transcript_26620/g.66899  ORF Transcript_26620/g.66899 Transcript_26620/m.66899 type:complete len:288 (-) Transcript_26620:183-1046(-)